MQTRFLGFLFVAASAVSCLDASLAWAQAPAKKIDFSRDIKPILSNKCFLCHGPSETDRKGGKNGLRLDTPAGSIADLGGHAAVVPGKPEASELVTRILSQDPEEVMPPKTSGKTLSPHEMELLKEWVRQGAHYSLHWSYIKPVRPTPPAVQDAAWPKNDIDRFLLARLESEKLKPAPEADRYALIRRVSLDLIGLPPTLEEVEAFVKDADPQAYEKLVDRLLQKSAYGEHWANLWLDLARYADSAGYADDPSRTIWLYRDYVIRALNQNKPFDQFTIEQLAGDLLPNATDEQIVATAFHRNTLTNSEGGTNDEEFRTVAVVDRVNTTMAVWMGTTIACAQCHDHKYDPISQDEFFRFYAFFNNTADADRRDESPLAMIYSDEQRRQKSLWEEERTKVELVAKTSTPALQASQTKWETAFPLNLAWLNAKPASARSTMGVAMTIAEDGSVSVPTTAKTDTFNVDISLPATAVRALRLEALPEPLLPSGGPGHASGNFVVTKIAATLNPPMGTALSGRYVRIELPGKGKMLSLAEVQAFAGKDNLAPKGEAKQSSTDYAGPANLAIDGNTDGRYVEAKSTTHTAASDDPWWELDLKSEQKLDRLVVWGRVDVGTVERLADFKISLLNEKREPVWEQKVAAPPKPNTEFSLSGRREIEFALALADFTQAGLDPAAVIKNPDPKTKGWAIGGEIGKPHALTLIPKAPIEAPAGSTLTVTIEQNSSFENHTLGHFRLSTTADAGVAEVSRTPAPVLDALRVAAATRTPAQVAAIAAYYLTIAPELDATRKQLATLTQQLAELKPETVPIMKELPQDQRRITKIQHRGNFMDLGAEVKEGTPATFPSLPADAPRDRLTLAKWVMSDENPLTGRVIANRYWEQIFGVGIVLTSEEFGSQGDQPFHPELLDWLATEMVRLKWDTKAFLRLLVTSAAYRQSSKAPSELQHRDPDNRLLARGPRFRLSAETLRDQALLVSGLLSPKMYGPPVKPAQPAMGLSAAFGSGIDWQTSAGADKYRRGLYTTWRRSSPYPSMATFDAPNRETCTVRRIRTNTPLQALVTLNDPVYIEAAQALARRMVSAGGKTPAERLAYGFRLCLAREPHPAEVARLVKLYEDAFKKYGQNADEARKMATEPLGPPPTEMSVPELAALTVVGNVLLNLDETIMKR
ncbi:MAG: Planctomycete cytochrome [Planctomycetaceae bacterium]|nr:Planctomycete cytochrome [Planctomycetaceae bacterium]